MTVKELQDALKQYNAIEEVIALIELEDEPEVRSCRILSVDEDDEEAVVLLICDEIRKPAENHYSQYENGD